MAVPGFDGNGNYSRARKWQDDEANSIGIRSIEHDEEDDTIAGALNKTFCRDGQAAATGNFNMANHQIKNVGAAVDDNDVVPFKQLTGSGGTPTPDFRKSITLAGANEDGRVKFGNTAADSAQGIGWANADMSLLGKGAQASKIRKRVTLNDLYNPLAGTPGNDVFIFDEAGWLNLTGISNNLSRDETGQTRAINVGYANYVQLYNSTTESKFSIFTSDAPTTVDPYKSITMRESLTYSGISHSQLGLHKKVGAFTNQIIGYSESQYRWVLQLGDSATETGGASGFGGSNFSLYGYNNSGAGGQPYMHIARDTRVVTFYDAVHAPSFGAGGGDTIISAPNTNIYLRPNGPSLTSEQCFINSGGDFVISNSNSGTTVVGGAFLGYGMRGKNGWTGTWRSEWVNFAYGGSAVWSIYNNANIYSWTTTVCDYRLKDDVKPLAGAWDAVKKMRPISFMFNNWKGYDDMVDGKERWGFLAHELQEVMPTMAHFEKDDPEHTQILDPVPILAALVAALQEALVRIEALEAA